MEAEAGGPEPYRRAAAERPNRGNRVEGEAGEGPAEGRWRVEAVVRKFICACALANDMLPKSPALLRNAPDIPTPTGPGKEGENWSLTMNIVSLMTLGPKLVARILVTSRRAAVAFTPSS